MTDFLVTGKKGNGKSLMCVGVIRDALMAGKRVATNLDIHLDALLPPSSRATLLRLPDHVSVEDLQQLGRGQGGVEESDNGLIVLDEAAKYFNSRSWGDKTRQPVLDWLVHSRKLGWDIWMICQGPEQVDKQLRTSLLEYWVTVKRVDKWPIPLVTPLARMAGFSVHLPRMSIGIVRHGFDRDSMIVERKIYRSRDLYAAYNTQQVFLDRDHPDAAAMHSVLSAWHTKGRYMPPPPPPLLDRLKAFFASRRVQPQIYPKHRLVALAMRLPPDIRVREINRMIANGFI